MVSAVGGLAAPDEGSHGSVHHDGLSVQLRGLNKYYGQVHAVRGVDLDCQPGILFGLIGPDGAGKSSMMKVIAGVMTFDAGQVTVLGQKIDSDATAEAIKPKIGFMPQGLGQNLYPDLSIEENINFIARLREVPDDLLEPRKDRLLKLTRLDKFRGRAMKNLSGGMKQKLGLVCTLIHEPRLIILDEPTTGVDPVSRRDFWAILTELVGEQNITALVSTAYMDEASRFHRVALLEKGEILATGDPDHLIEDIKGVAVVVQAEPQMESLERLKGKYDQVVALSNVVRAFVPDRSMDEAEADVRGLLTGLDIKQIITDTPDLEDIFIATLIARGDVDLRGRSGLVTSGEAPVSAKMESDTAIEALGLIRDFGDFRAVDEVSFQVKPGEIFGLLGANGAGKSTVIKMLTGILPPSGGEGHVGGIDMRRPGGDIKERIGYMSQAFSLYQDLTVLENIRLYAGIYGVSRRRLEGRLDWLLELAELKGQEARLAGSLPMGMRQRLALSCALVHRPPILFLDEPTSGVDPVGRREFWDILFTLSRQEGVAMLVTTHYMTEAEHCDHLSLMHAGRVIAAGTPEKMKSDVEQQFGKLLEITCKEPYAAQKVLRDKGFEEATLHGRRVQVLVDDPQPAIEKIKEILEAAHIPITRVVQAPITMENVFVQNVLYMESQPNEGQKQGGG